MKLINIEHIYSNRRYLIDFAVRTKAGANVDWSTYTSPKIHFVVKRDVTDADSAALIHKSTLSGIVMDGWNPVTGTIELTINNTASTNLPDGRYVWELLFECTELGRIEIDFGTLQVTESVAKTPSSLPAEG